MRPNGNVIAIVVLGLVMAVILWFLSGNVAAAVSMAAASLIGAAIIQWLLNRPRE